MLVDDHSGLCELNLNLLPKVIKLNFKCFGLVGVGTWEGQHLRLVQKRRLRSYLCPLVCFMQ